MAIAAVSMKNWQWNIGPPVEPTETGWRYHLITYFVDTTTGRKEAQVYDVDVLHTDTQVQQRDKMSAAAVAAGAASETPFVEFTESCPTFGTNPAAILQTAHIWVSTT